MFHTQVRHLAHAGCDTCHALANASFTHLGWHALPQDNIFSAVYCGERAPLSPAAFLYHWWRLAGHLAGYQQQDAHEFYLSLLEGISNSTIRVRGLPCLAGGVVGTRRAACHHLMLPFRSCAFAVCAYLC